MISHVLTAALLQYYEFFESICFLPAVQGTLGMTTV